MPQKRLLILGAGVYQAPGIQKAVHLGHYVITADNQKENIGHRFSHQQIHCTVTDKERLASIAQEWSVDGICTFSSDVAVSSVGFVNEVMGFPGLTYAAAEIMSHKHLFRLFLKENGLPCPEFAFGESFEDLQSFFDNKKSTLIVKPVDASGSKGVSRVGPSDKNALRAAFEYARSSSRSGVVVVEDCIDGTEVGGDGLLCGGKFLFLEMTNKYLDGLIVSGHSFPSLITSEERARIKNKLERCCALLNYNDGPLNFDVMLCSDDVVIIEMSPRTGGNGIPAVICRATGADLEKMVIDMSLGQLPALPEKMPARGAGSWVFGSKREGILRSINHVDGIKKTVPELFDFVLAVPVGSKIPIFNNNSNLAGYALFDCGHPDHYADIVARIQNALKMDVYDA